MMESAHTSETSVDNYFTRRYIPEDKSVLHNHLLFISPEMSKKFTLLGVLTNLSSMVECRLVENCEWHKSVYTHMVGTCLAFFLIRSPELPPCVATTPNRGHAV
jgi:hypothetical protein